MESFCKYSQITAYLYIVRYQHHLNFRISGQKLNKVKKTKYLGIYLDEHLTWNFQLSQIKTKLRRSCGLLAKLRYHVRTKLYASGNPMLTLPLFVKTICRALFWGKTLRKGLNRGWLALANIWCCPNFSATVS